ncbi:signal peptidase I, partial [Candidatus Bathyarchaeota archaeon]
MRGKVKTLSLAVKAVLVLVCLVMVIPSVFRLCPFLVGADASYIVLGGSMKPTLCPGDLAFSVKVNPSDVKVGDIVVVKTDSGVYMHRVLEKRLSGDGVLFRLKGDANEDPDSSYVAGSQIAGKTIFSLPTGYLYTKTGYILMVATPLMLLAANQAIKIYRLYDTRRRRRRGLKAILLGNGGRRRRKISILDTTSTLLLIIIVASGTHMMTPYFASGSGSFFTDTETSRCVIQVATWKVSTSISCSVDPNPTVKLGENVTVSGCIRPARKGVDVILTYRVGENVTKRTVKTDVNGCYVDVFTPGIPGNWTV